jgi:hypothetical protein
MSAAVALLAVMLAAAAGQDCLQDGATVAGRFAWLSLTRPNGKPIPAPYLLLDIPVCLRDAAGVHSSGLLRLLPADPAALDGLKKGDVLVVSARYSLPEDFNDLGDIAANDAHLERQ